MTIDNLFSNAKKILLSKKAIGIYLGIVNAGSVVATAINIKDLYQTHNPDIFFNLAKKHSSDAYHRLRRKSPLQRIKIKKIKSCL
ncbi:hypothetical protein COS75_02220 [Candidatus Pacearchaeota archaeon CG06_land_8_20_14_3_00_35_12]|nr:MAG: hypothetical protein COS75_02220 [Candidatus Pacearchaeota archaeon CG06_land_8_20_14_3_00_35_12]